MAKKNNDFDLVNLPEAARDPEIKQEDFTLQQADGSIHEQKFQTKPTTFLKDSLKRFSKNKSSVVASYILGVLILLAIFVPIFNTSDVSTAANSSLNNLEPKLFDAGSGFWDGTKKVTHEPVDVNNNYMPNELTYLPGGVTNLVPEPESYTNDSIKFGKEGYMQFGYYGNLGLTEGIIETGSVSDLVSDLRFTLDLSSSHLSVTKFNVVDEAKLKENEGSDKEYPENYKMGKVSVEFCYSVPGDEDVIITVIDPSVTHNIGNGSASVDITDTILAASGGKTSFENFWFRFTVTGTDEATPSDNVCTLIQNFVVETDSSDERLKAFLSYEADDESGLSGISFVDAMNVVCRDAEVVIEGDKHVNVGDWTVSTLNKFVKKIYLGKAVFASFDYDSYKATLGKRNILVNKSDIDTYKKNKWLDHGILVIPDEFGNAQLDMDTLNAFKAAHDGKIVVIKDPARCPIVTEFTEADILSMNVDQRTGKASYKVKTDVMYYRYIGMDSMPRYIFGTDKSGKDMFKYVFEGLRNSLALGVVTFIVCFLFGLFWGSVSGYFGGAVDMVMERVTDILSGVPWIVVMTLIILKSGKSDFGTFALALCLTGWIGTASTTRTQFYRFRGREYVLASRTLGASDGRLIAKHILPNAMGTIITGAVLMIPSVIFSEATISYLGLGFKNLSSLGVILSSNQAELFNHPYQLIFPSVVIALVMISFNLFGNGLRDAINPSLKGEGE